VGVPGRGYNSFLCCLVTLRTLSPFLPCSRPRPPSPLCPLHRALPRGSARSLPQHRRLGLGVASGQADIESLRWPTWAAALKGWCKGGSRVRHRSAEGVVGEAARARQVCVQKRANSRAPAAQAKTRREPDGRPLWAGPVANGCGTWPW
jgi:hypothetical protein